MKRIRGARRARPIGLLLAMTAFLMLPNGSFAAQDPQTVVHSLLGALSAGDLDAAMALVADNATIKYSPAQYGPPNNCCAGKAAVRLAYGNLIAGKAQFTPLTPLTVNGDTVSARVRQTGSAAEASGVQAIDADVSFTIQNGLMVNQTVTFTPETIAAGFHGIAPPAVLPTTGHAMSARAGEPWLIWGGLVAAFCLLLTGLASRRRAS